MVAQSVPVKGRQAHPRPTKRGRIEKTMELHTPIRQVHFFSSPRCPPSPHHKPRASSPLRISAISPTLEIQRPENRQPLGELKLTARNTAKNFTFFEDTDPFKSGPTLFKPITPNKSNNKENIPPFAKEHKSQHNQSTELLLRPQPRDPFSIMSDSILSSTVKNTSSMVMEETITQEYSGRKVTETYKTITTKIGEESMLSFNAAIQGSMIDDGIRFAIYHDEDGSMEILDDGDDSSILSVDVENDKENQDPAKMDTMDLEDSPTSHVRTKRKQVPDE